MRVRHTKLLSLLFSLTTILLHAGEIPTDTLLAHFYNRAAKKDTTMKRNVASTAPLPPGT